MRELKFRGKRLDNSKWVYGPWIYELFHKDKGAIFIREKGSIQGYQIEKETIGQFTGLRDVKKWKDLKESEREQWTRDGNMPSEWKGREIYEGDVVRKIRCNIPIVIKWVQNICGFEGVYKDKSSCVLNILSASEYEVIGNIHENPDLLNKD